MFEPTCLPQAWKVTGLIFCVSIFYCALNCNAFKLLLIGHIYENISENDIKIDKLTTFIGI